MKIYTISYAKAQLSALVARVEAGEDVVIGRGDRPAVRLIPYRAGKKRSILGASAMPMAMPDAGGINKALAGMFRDGGE